MRSITIGFILGMFALAKESGFRFLGLKDHGREFGVLVGAVAEGLAFGQPAGAPGVSFTGFQLYLGWEFRCDCWLGHDSLLECLFKR